MNQGEIIQASREHTRDLLVQEQRIVTLEKKVAEMDELLKSPIRRETYAARQKHKQEGSGS